MNTVPVTAIITGYKKIQQLISTLKKIQGCKPAPAEVLVHIDDGEYRTAESIKSELPDIKVIISDENIGPGGGRNKLIKQARYEFVASFDDDSYPLDADYFNRIIVLFNRFTDAKILSPRVYHIGENVDLNTVETKWVTSFCGAGCAYRRTDFLSTSGYVALPIAYGMEEVDLSLRMYAQGGRVLHSDWLRVFHNTDLKHHESSIITSNSIANLALLTYLRYPFTLWWFGVFQVMNRIIWLISNGRGHGVVSGILMIPFHLYKYKSYKEQLTFSTVMSYLALRRKSINVIFNINDIS